MKNLTNLLIKIIIYFSICTPFHHILAQNSSTQSAQDVIHAIKYSKFDTLKQMLHTKQLDVHLKELVKTELFLKDPDFCDFEKITQFINNNPNLYRKNTLLHKAEKCITNHTNNVQIFKWFHKNYPKTPLGHKFYAMSAAKLLQQRNDKVKKDILNDSWIQGDFTYEEQVAFYNKYYKFLHITSNIKKADRLIHKKQYRKAHHLIKQFNKTYQTIFNLYLHIQKNDEITTVKNNLMIYTPGLAYQYLNNFVKNEKYHNHKSILKILHIIEKDSFFHNISYSLRMSTIFHYIRAKKYNMAYKIIQNYTPIDKNHNLQVHFLSGLICLNFLNKPKDALKYFHQVVNLSSHPEDSARGRYWLARSYEKIGDTTTANKVFEKLIQKYQTTFYGYMASIKLNKKKVHLQKANIHPKFTNIKKQEIQIIKLFIEHNLESLARIYIRHLMNNAKNNAERLYFIEQLKSDNMIYNHLLARVCVTKGLFVKEFLYPLMNITQPLHIQKAVIHAITYQESAFNPNALNTTGKIKSTGLMQLIDHTAAEMAAILNVPYKDQKLRLPEYNILLGSYYIKQLKEMFNESYILAIASYNAGLTYVNKWTNYIDYPTKNINDILTWIELIPFVITRNYVSKVLGLIQTYENLINQHDNIILQKYLINNNQCDIP